MYKCGNWYMVSLFDEEGVEGYACGIHSGYVIMGWDEEPAGDDTCTVWDAEEVWRQQGREEPNV